MWAPISAECYQETFNRYGGSLAVHPNVVHLVEGLGRRPARYMGVEKDGTIVAAVPLWGEHILATRPALDHYGQGSMFDIGNHEIVLPMSYNAISVPFTANNLSPLHEGVIANLVPQGQMILAKGFRTGAIRRSPKSQFNLRYLWRRLQDAGAQCHPVNAMTADALASLYISLFRKRWQCSPLGTENLPDALRALNGLLCGFVLSFGEGPIAVQLLFKVETPHWVLVDFVNQGVDPAFFSYSPGSVLLYLNLLQLEDEAISVGKELRFSFGYNDAPYKEQWGYPMSCYRTSASGL